MIFNVKKKKKKKKKKKLVKKNNKNNIIFEMYDKSWLTPNHLQFMTKFFFKDINISSILIKKLSKNK